MFLEITADMAQTTANARLGSPAESEATTPFDEARFNDLMKATYRKVFNMAYRLAGSRSDAEDLTQEAFVRAFRSFRDYEGDRPFENWIYRIVTRLFLDLLRSRRRRVTAVSYDAPLTGVHGDENLFFEQADARPNPEGHVMADKLSEEIERALASLAPEQRLLVTLADIEGLPYSEISAILDKPVGTVRSRLHRAHKHLRARIEAIRKEDAQAPRSMPLNSRLIPSS
jgi:RNA polymerase sigma-70 factor (ECF subfamily)